MKPLLHCTGRESPCNAGAEPDAEQEREHCRWAFAQEHDEDRSRDQHFSPCRPLVREQDRRCGTRRTSSESAYPCETATTDPFLDKESGAELRCHHKREWGGHAAERRYSRSLPPD